MKKYLKNNQGMALPMVLVIMLILSMLALSLATYANQSFRSYRYMDAQKQAYYLARAGVEAGAYAYQSASTKTSDKFKDYDVAGYSGIDSIISVLQDVQFTENDDGTVSSTAGKVTSNKVYLRYTDSDENDGTMWDGLEFIAVDADSSLNIDSSILGYFTVEAMGAQNLVKQNKVDENGNEVLDAQGNPVKEPVPMAVIEFRSTAVCFDSSYNEVKNVVHGFVYPSDVIGGDGKTIYDSDGLLSQNKSDFSNVETETLTVKATDGPTEPDGPGFLNRVVYYAKRLWNGVVKTIFGWLYPSGWTTTVEGYQYVTGGDLTFSKPANSDTIKIHKDENNVYSFVTSGNMYIEAGLDVIPNKGSFSTVGIFGNDIIVDGDIKMGVYINNPDLALGGFSEIISTFGNRYRLGTVIIGAGSKSGGQYKEYLSLNEGGITTQGGAAIENANRIFFNGNVTLTVYMQGSTTETYRIFSAGDVCLFNGLYANDDSVAADSDSQAHGIDLVKFFVDSVVDGDPNYAHYGESVRENLEAVRKTYYGDPADTENPGEPSYIKKDGDTVISRPLRVISVNRNASTSENMLIDGKEISEKHGDYYLWEYILPPSSTQSSNINWGKPLRPANFDK